MTTITNKQLLDTINESLKPLLEKHDKWLEDHEARIDSNTSSINVLTPKVQNHEVVLYGKQDDRKDTGIIGALNKIEAAADSIKVWVRTVGTALVIWALIGGIEKVIGIVVEFEKLNP